MVIEFVSAVLSGLAFVGVVVALVLQHRELVLTRAGTTLARDLADEQRHEMRRSAESLAKQTFESTFFQMLRVLGETRDAVVCPSTLGPIVTPMYSGVPGEEIRGRKAILVMSRFLRRNLTGIPAKDLEKAYLEFYGVRSASDLGQYFRVLDRLFKYVKESDAADKRNYTGLVRAQVSDAEFFMVFYNAISSMGRVNALPLSEEFDLFDNFAAGFLANPEEHRRLVESKFAEDSPHYRDDAVRAAMKVFPP